MKLKSFKTLQVLYVVVSASALMAACNTKVTEPLKLMSGSSFGSIQKMISSDNAGSAENYGVPPAHSVQFTQRADEQLQDLSY